MEEVNYFVSYGGREDALTLRRLSSLLPGERIPITFVKNGVNSPDPYQGDFQVTRSVEVSSSESGAQVRTVEGVLLNCPVLAGRVILRYYQKNGVLLLLRP